MVAELRNTDRWRKECKKVEEINGNIQRIFGGKKTSDEETGVGRK